MERKSSRRKRIISIIISGFCSLVIFLIIISSCFSWNVFSRSSMYDTLYYSHYTSKIKIEIKEDMAKLSETSGVSAEVFNKIVDESGLEKDIDFYFSYAKMGIDQKLNTNGIVGRSKEILTSYFNRVGIEKSEDLDNKISEISTTCANIYSNGVRFELISRTFKVLMIYKKLLNRIIFGMIILLLALLFVIYFINKWKHRAYRYFIYVFTYGAGMALIFSGLSLLLKLPKITGIESLAMFSFFNFLKNTILVSTFVSSCGLIIISLLILIPLKIITKNKYS